MKKINLLILLFASCTYLSVAQVSSIEFNLPQNATKIDKSNLDSSKQKDKIVIMFENIYNIGNV